MVFIPTGKVGLMILRLEEVCAGSKGERTQRVMIFTSACSLSAGLGLSFLVNCGISEHSLVLQESRILRFNHGLSGIEGKTITSMYCLSVEEGRTHATGHDFHSGLLAFHGTRVKLTSYGSHTFSLFVFERGKRVHNIPYLPF